MSGKPKKAKGRGAWVWMSHETPSPAREPRLIHRFDMVRHYEGELLQELNAVIDAGPDALTGAVAEKWRDYWKLTHNGQEMPEDQLLRLRGDIDLYMDRAKRLSALLSGD
jgi:hypothetical protein